jgi:hypothetical protein
VSEATLRSEILRRINADELSALTDFTLVQATTNQGICSGCGRTLPPGEPCFLVKCVPASFARSAMHPECFLIWREMCTRIVAEQRTRGDGAVARARSARGEGAPRHNDRAVDYSRSFCSKRLELLNSYVQKADTFADAVRWNRISPARADGISSAQAGRDVQLAHDAYDQHVKQHGCSHGGVWKRLD